MAGLQMALAAEAGQWEVVKDLAARNANLEAKDRHGMTPMALAAEEGQWEVVKDLAARKANLEAKNKDGRTPMAAGSHLMSETD